MPPHWSVGRLPELSHLSDADRRMLLRRCLGPRARVRLLVQPAAAGLLAALIGSWVVVQLAPRAWPWTALGLLLLVGAAYRLVLVGRIRGALRETMILELDGERSPVCLACGFDLRGTEADRCPECGAATRGRAAAGR